MASVELRMPADIFEEMAGAREIVPVQSSTAEANVNLPEKRTPINENRLGAASSELFANVDDFGKYLKKIFKKIVKLQEGDKKNDTAAMKKAAPKPGGKMMSKMIPPPVKGYIMLIKALVSLMPLIKEKVFEAFMSFIGTVWTIIKMISKGIGWVFKQLWGLIKFLTGIIFDVVKWISKKVWNIVKWLFKKLGQLFKWLGKQLWKVVKLVWKGIKKVAKAIWDVLVKLFHRIRKKTLDKFFKTQPQAMALKMDTIKPHNMEAPPNSFEPMEPKEPELGTGGGGQNHTPAINEPIEIREELAKPFNSKSVMNMSNTFKKPKPNQENVIWYYLKPVLKKFADIIGRIVKRIFQPIINKIVDFVKKIIFRFFLNLALSFWMGPAAPAAAVGMTIISLVSLGIQAINFVNDLRNVTSDLGGDPLVDDSVIEDSGPEEMDEEEEEEKIKEEIKDARYFRNKLEKMEEEGHQDELIYRLNEAKYIAELIKQAEQTGNLDEAKRLRAALQLPDEGEIDVYSIKPEVLKKFDRKGFLEEEAKRTAEKFKKYNEAAKTEIMHKDEMEELLIAANGEPEWCEIAKRLISSIAYKIKENFSKETANNAIYMLTTYNYQKTVEEYKGKIDINELRKKQAVARADGYDKFRSFIDDTFDFLPSWLYDIFSVNETIIEHNENAKDPEIAKKEIFDTYAISFTEETKKYREVNEELNQRQNQRLTLWTEILEVLKETRKQTT